MSATERESKSITCGQRTAMICCPCKHLYEPDLATTDCCVCCCETPLQNIITIPPMIELAGTWIGDNPLALWFIILRVILTIGMVHIWLFGFLWYASRNVGLYYFIYWTIWTHTMNTITMIVKTWATIKVYRASKKSSFDLYKPIDTMDPLWNLYIAQSILVQISIPMMGMLVLNYFAFVYDGDFPSLIGGINAMQLHAANFVLAWGDYMLSAQKMYYKAAYWSVLMGTIYTLWTLIFEAIWNESETGDTYIYAAYDWRKDLDSDGDDDLNLAPIKFYIASAIILTVMAAVSTVTKNLIFICCVGDKYNQQHKPTRVADTEEEEDSVVTEALL